MAEFDLSQAQPLVPPEYDISQAQLTDMPPPGPFARGVKSGVAGVKSSLYGFGALAARGATNALPAAAAPITTGLEAAALKNVAAQNEIAAQGAVTYEDVVADPSRAGEFIKYAAGSIVPSLATMVAGGAVGAGLGALRAGAMTVAARAAAIKTGALVGAVAPDFAVEAGSIYPEALQTGVENPALRSVAGGAGAAAIDFLTIPAAVRALMPAGRAATRAGTLGGALKSSALGAVVTGGKVAGAEGVQELTQTFIERAAAGQDISSPDAISEYINATLTGMIGGGMIGGPVGGVRGATAPVADLRTNEAETRTTAPDLGPIVPDSGTIVPETSTPETLHADLTAQHAAATEQLSTLGAAVAQAQQAHDALVGARAALDDESKLPIGERRTKSEITKAKKAATEQVKAAKAKIEELGGQAFAARTALDTLTPQLEAARSAFQPAVTPAADPTPLTYPDLDYPTPATPYHPIGAGPADIAVQQAAELADFTTSETRDVEFRRAEMQRGQQKQRDLDAIAAARTEELGRTPDQQIAAAAVATDETPTAIAEAFARAKPRTEAEHIDRAVKGVQAAIGGVPHETQTRGVAAAAPAMNVHDYIVEELAKKNVTSERKLKIAASIDTAISDITASARSLPPDLRGGAIAAMVKTRIGGKVSADVQSEIAKHIEQETTTRFSKGATEVGADGAAVDYAGSLAMFLQEKTGTVLGRWKGKMSAAEQRALFGRALGKGTIVIDGERETVANQVKVAFGQDYDDRNITAWRDLNTPQAPSESNAALTQDDFAALPEPAQEAASTEYARIFREKGIALRAQLAGIIGDRPELKVMTFAAEPGGPIGSYTRTGPLKAVIAMATNAKSLLGVADHEGYHFAEDWLLSTAERRIVDNAMKPGRPLFEALKSKLQQYDRENRTSLTDEVTGTPAEARAYGFEFWRRGELQAEGHLAAIWQKLQQFFERISNAVKGLGFQSVEDVFTALDRGQMAEREMVAPEGRASYESRGADYLQSPAFKKWFGDSKVVDKDGKPLVVFHGTNADVTEFDDTKSGLATGRGRGTGLGFWFTASPQSANIFANMRNEGGNVIPVYLSVQNPYRLTAAKLTELMMATAKLDENAQWGAVRKFRDTLIEDRYDGIVVPRVVRNEIAKVPASMRGVLGRVGVLLPPTTGVEGSGDRYVAFSPTQIKSAIGNTGAFDPSNPDIRFSGAGGQSWYRSALTEAVGSIASKQASAQGWKDQIKGLISNGKARQVELDAVGLNDWLNLQQGKVTKDQVMAFLGENGVRVEEVVLGDGLPRPASQLWFVHSTGNYNPIQIDAEQSVTSSQSTYREDVDNDRAKWTDASGNTLSTDQARVLAKEWEEYYASVEQADNKTKFSGYQLPGGGNYRELLLTLPPNDIAPKWAARREDGEWGVRDEVSGREWAVDATTEAGAIAEATRYQSNNAGERAQTFTSPHYDQPNILAHVRFNERTDADGKRVLFLEELQSDWAQKGRKEGFRSDSKLSNKPATYADIVVGDEIIGWGKVQAVQGEKFDVGGLWITPSQFELRLVAGRDRGHLSGGLHGNMVPSAPFVGKTEAWTALALKRMIRYAAENGFDKIAWTTGEQQAERYDLSKHIDSLHYDPYNKQLSARKGDQQVLKEQNVPPEKIEDYVGKDAAKKLLATELNGAGNHELKGLALRVGGEGMKGYYDKIVPSVANEILRKLGGGKVGEVILPIQHGVYDTSLIDPYENTSIEPTGQPGFTISPALAEHAANGLPLFSRAAVEMDNRKADGDLEAMQMGEQYAKIIQHAKVPSDLLTRLLGIAKDDFAGGLGRWWTNNVSTPNYISATSAAFKNVYQAFNTYIRYGKILNEQLVREKLPSWYKASDADRKAAFDVMLKRTVEKYSRQSLELADLLNTLTPTQRTLYDQATGMIAGVLQRQFDSQKETRRRQLTTPGEYEKWLANRQEQVDSLLDTGYVPLRRYGDYSVAVFMESPDGTRVKAGLEFFNSPSAAKAASVAYAREIERSGVALKVELGRRSKNERDSGVSLEQFLGTLRRQGIDISQAERERLVVAMTNADSIVRTQMMRREGLAGFSTDSMRVLHEFGVNTTNEIAYARFAPVLDAALDGAEVTADVNSVTSEPVITIGESFGTREDGVENNLWKREGPMSGFHKDRANALADAVLVPNRQSAWATKLRTMGVMYFIGGSISGAAVNAMSIPMLLVPHLSMHTDYINATTTALKSWKDSWQHYNILRDMDRMKNPDAETAAKLDAAGITKEMRAAIVAAADHIFDTEIHMMLGISQGTLYSKSRNLQRAAEAWMAPFRMAEQTNRLASFMSAYKVGAAKGLTDQALFRFASNVVDATQNNYNVSNRPGIMNNPVGALMFQFKSFPLFIIEAVSLMHKQSPKSAVYMLLGLTAMAGVQGLPFAEELLNLIDVISQQLFGSPFNSRRAMRNVIKSASDAIGVADLSDAVMRGLVNEITGVGIATRVSSGLLPGTRIGTADTAPERVLSEMAGAPFSMVKATMSNVGGFVSGVATGDWTKAADAVRGGGPIALRNLVKGAEQLSSGYASDTKGRKVADVSTLDGLLQLTGLSSAKVTNMQDHNSIVVQTKAFHTQVSQDMQEQLVRAYRDGDTAKQQEITEFARKWNAQYPNMPLVPNPAAIRRAIQLANVPLDRRAQMMLSRRMQGEFRDIIE